MTTPLYPYSTYKPSGVPWLGDVPEHWQVKRLKRDLLLNDSGVWGDDFSEWGTVVLRSTEQTQDGEWRILNPARIVLALEDIARKELQEGDIVVTKSSGSLNHIGKASLVTMQVAALRCCFSNFMQRLRPRQQTSPQYIWRLLNSQAARLQYVLDSSTTTGLGNLNGTVLGNLVFAAPPLPEQRAIVRYLDYVDRRIRRYVSAKRKLIALLEEEKQAIVNRAVTRGLDPNVRLKPSGVEWLGDVPEHWEVPR